MLEAPIKVVKELATLAPELAGGHEQAGVVGGLEHVAQHPGRALIGWGLQAKGNPEALVARDLLLAGPGLPGLEQLVGLAPLKLERGVGGEQGGEPGGARRERPFGQAVEARGKRLIAGGEIAHQGVGDSGEKGVEQIARAKRPGGVVHDGAAERRQGAGEGGDAPGCGGVGARLPGCAQALAITHQARQQLLARH